MSTANLAHRFAYHPPKDPVTVSAHENTRDILGETARELDLYLPEGREKAVAITKLEEAMFWANAAIAREFREGLSDEFKVGDQVIADGPGNVVIEAFRDRVATVVGKVDGGTYDLEYPCGAVQWSYGHTLRLAPKTEDEVAEGGLEVDEGDEEFEIEPRPLEVGDEILTKGHCEVTPNSTRGVLIEVDRPGSPYPVRARFEDLDPKDRTLRLDEFERVPSEDPSGEIVELPLEVGDRVEVLDTCEIVAYREREGVITLMTPRASFDLSILLDDDESPTAFRFDEVERVPA